MRTITVKLTTLILVACCLTACGFKLRSASELNPALHKLYIEPGNSNSRLITEIKQQLVLHGIQPVNSPAQAKIQLQLSQYTHDTTLPITFDSSNASTYQYKLSVRYQLVTSRRKAITPVREAPISEDITYNANQVGTPVFTPVLRREMTRRLAITIVNGFTDPYTQQLIHKAFSRKHANH